MNLCEKIGVSFNEYERFCSLRMTMFFAEVKKDFFTSEKLTHRGRKQKVMIFSESVFVFLHSGHCEHAFFMQAVFFTNV